MPTQGPGHKKPTSNPKTEKKDVLINTKISNNDSAQLGGSRNGVREPLVLSEDKLKNPDKPVVFCTEERS